VSGPRLLRPSTSDEPVRVLLLHGLGCTAGDWAKFAGLAAPELELWDVELPWHGLDVPTWSHDPDQVAPVVEAAAGFDAVVAHSFAAGALLEAFATKRLPPVPSVLVSPFHRREPDFDWETITYYLNDFHLIFEEALRIGTDSLTAERRSRMAAAVRDRIGPYGWLRFFEAYLRSPFLDLTAVSAPQLVLAGDADISIRPGDGAALADALPRGSYAHLPGCGHFPMLEQPDAFARVVSAFLRGSDRHRPRDNDHHRMELT
jgi:pimeloyl-ACP methyl ester carboxylesterase